jgi:site-specific recombinase XerD
MEDMPRPRPLYLQKHTTRHGRTVYYVRVKRGKLVRIHGEYGSDEFNAQVCAAQAGTPLPTRTNVNSASLQWLYDRYRESSKWSDLSEATRRQRQNILSRVMAKSGHEPFKAIDSSDIEAGKDTRKDTPAQARNYLDAMKGLFRWAKKNDHVQVDPTLGVEAPQRARGASGFQAWDQADLERYRAKWPLGTRQRVWVEVLLGTGLRRGDAVVAGRQHVKDGVFSLTTEKTGMMMHCVLERELLDALVAGPTSDLAFICGERGEPLTKESFGNLFKAACKAAGVTGKNKAAHGIRKLAATIDAERGYSERELEAKYGWTGGFMASLYTKTANRKNMVIAAAKRSMLLPSNSVIAAGQNQKLNQRLKKGLVRSRKVEQS